MAGLQHHAPDPGVQRPVRQVSPDGGELVLFVHGAQLGQQLVAIGDGLGPRGFHKGEALHVAQLQGLHAQDDARERAAQNFGIGEAGPCVEILLLVQADADPVGDTATSATALLRRCLADGLHQQLLDLAAVAVAFDTRRAAVDHIADTGHGEGGLGHVGGQHDPPAGVGIEHPVLLGLREAREQGQHLGATQGRLVAQVLTQMVGRLADFSLTRQEHQDVALVTRVAPELVHRIGDGLIQAVVAALLEGAPAHLHRIGAARDHDHRRRA